MMKQEKERTRVKAAVSRSHYSGVRWLFRRKLWYCGHTTLAYAGYFGVSCYFGVRQLFWRKRAILAYAGYFGVGCGIVGSESIQGDPVKVYGL